jgi:hypothetical protein
MSISISTVWEIRQNGSDTNGGGYVSGGSGTDYSQQAAAQIAVTNAVTNGTTTITSATANFTSAHQDNLAYIAGGTGAITGDWYQVISVTNSTTIVVDRATGLTAGTGVTFNLGGALATPGVLTNALVNAYSGTKAWMKYSATAYSLTTATAGPGGPLNVPASTVFTLEGYDVARGDRTANRPSYRWTTAPGSNTYAIVHASGVRNAFLNCKIDGNFQAHASGINIGIGVGGVVMDCVVAYCIQSGTIGFNVNGGVAERCEAIGCVVGFTGSAAQSGYLISQCTAVSCVTGFNLVGYSGPVARCLAYSCTTGFATSGTGGAFYDRCTADGCVTGFDIATGGSLGYLAGCVASNCSGGGGIGFKVTTDTVLFLCGVYNNGTHLSGTPAANEGQVTLTADPYVNQIGADFRPNTTAGGGASLRAAGIGVFGQTNNTDIGAVQHSDPTGGGILVHPGMQGGCRG